MLTLEIKINRLFELGHNRDQPERTVDEVASAVSQRTGEVVDPLIIAEARAGQRLSLEPEIAAAICAEFGVPRLYLSEEDDPEIVRLDLLVQLWILIRDRDGHLAARGHDLDIETIKTMISMLRNGERPVAAPTESACFSAGA